MPDLLAEYPEDDAVPNNNDVETTSDYLEAELWKALRNGHYERFQQLINQVQAGTRFYEAITLWVASQSKENCHFLL